MPRERVAPQSEVIRVIALEGSPCFGVPHLQVKEIRAHRNAKIAHCGFVLHQIRGLEHSHEFVSWSRRDFDRLGSDDNSVPNGYAVRIAPEPLTPLGHVVRFSVPRVPFGDVLEHFLGFCVRPHAHTGGGPGQAEQLERLNALPQLGPLARRNLVLGRKRSAHVTPNIIVVDVVSEPQDVEG